MRSTLLAIAFVSPAVVTLVWGDTLALYVGSARPGSQAPYFAPPTEELGRHRVEVVTTRRIVPSEGIPAEVRVGHANNNLDVVRHQGRVYLAFRTAPDFFPQLMIWSDRI